MSQIDELVNKFCPNGVVFVDLENVVAFRRGTTITKKDADGSGVVPVVSGGRTEAYFHSESNRAGQTIVVAGSGAYAGFVSFWEGPVFVSDAFSVDVSENYAIPKFMYYFLKNRQKQLHDMKRGSGVPHVYGKDLAKMKFPLVPLEVQREIVRILDNFTELEAELEAELETRKKQYEFYRDQLLTFPEQGGVRWVPMGDIGEFIRGNGLQKSDLGVGQIPAIHYGQVHTDYGIWADRAISNVAETYVGNLRFAEPGNLVIATTSEDDSAVCKATAWVGERAAAVSSDACIFRHPMNPKFVAYFFQSESFQSQKAKHITGTKVRRISPSALEKMLIPDVPLDEQQRIVEILDKFDALVNDLTVGLPAEIEARRKQYEYYRDKLLTFPEVAA